MKLAEISLLIFSWTLEFKFLSSSTFEFIMSPSVGMKDDFDL